MHVANHVESLIGSTPLIDLSSLLPADVQATGTRVLGKYEATNPGGSVKDRVARYMLDAAEASGELQPGGTVIADQDMEPVPDTERRGEWLIIPAMVGGAALPHPAPARVHRRACAVARRAAGPLEPGKSCNRSRLARADLPHSPGLCRGSTPPTPTMQKARLAQGETGLAMPWVGRRRAGHHPVFCRPAETPATAERISEM